MYMPVVKFFAGLEFERKSSFCKRLEGFNPMKKILFLFLLAALALGKDVGWAAQRNVPGISVDLLNDDYLNEDTYPQRSVSDPLEPVNRVFFEFNDKLYFWVLKPVNKGYSTVVPPDIRQCIGNFFDNLASPVSFLNNVLQGRFKDAWVVVSRFFINTTLGVYGFGDVAATDFNIVPKPADFGQTLGVWGVGEGVYICLPVFGPSNIRDSVGLAADFTTHPTSFMNMNLTERSAYYMSNRINTMSLSPDVYEELIKYSLDPYIAARQAFHEYRQEKIDRQKNTEE
jgi:phospholipid-binding lipoprotein MlaA